MRFGPRMLTYPRSRLRKSDSLASRGSRTAAPLPNSSSVATVTPANTTTAGPSGWNAGPSRNWPSCMGARKWRSHPRGRPSSGVSNSSQKTSGSCCSRTLEYNLSQFESATDLPPAFHEVRDAVLEQQLPLVFWDEFDTPLEGRPLGWLRHFLAPMQDGQFREGPAFHPLGPAVFVFAGGTAATLDEFSGGAAVPDPREAKLPDFVSRLRGYVN